MSYHADLVYLDLAQQILEQGKRKEDRTGTGTISLFGAQMRFDLRKGFPLLTSKKMATRAIIHELLWFLDGDTNLKTLLENGVHIWDGDAYRDYKELADREGFDPLTREEFLAVAEQKGYDMGPIYGKQWRKWTTDKYPYYLDQLGMVIKEIEQNPDSRRLIVSTWNPAEIPQMVLPPCHVLYQFYVSDGELSCQLYQRSADFFLGVPFNIASYAILTHMVAQVTGLKVGEFIHTIGDAHIYINHVNQIRKQIRRADKLPPMPTLELNPEIKSIDEFTIDDIKIEGYYPLPRIRGEVSNG